MNSMIANKLTPIWSELKAIVQSDPDWYIKSIQQEDRKLMQGLYLIRYYPAYLYEYYKIFCLLLQHSEVDLNVLSIGNGPSIDFDALQLAKVDQSRREVKSYVGIDHTLWTDNESISDIPRKQIWGTVDNLSFSEISPNVVFFPKSLNSLSYLEFEALKQQLQMSFEVIGPLWIVISYKLGKTEFEKNRIQSLLHVLSQWHKLEVTEEYSEEGEGVYLEKLDSCFAYPESVWSDCLRWDLNSQDLNPIKTNEQLSYEMFLLTSVQ